MHPDPRGAEPSHLSRPSPCISWLLSFFISLSYWGHTAHLLHAEYAVPLSCAPALSFTLSVHRSLTQGVAYLLLMTAVARMDAMPACWGSSWMSVCTGAGPPASTGSCTGCLGVLWGSVTRNTCSSPPEGTTLVTLHQRASSVGYRH